MSPLEWLLLLGIGLIAIFVVVIRKTSGQQPMAEIGPDGEPVNSSASLYRSRSFYSSPSATSDVLSDMLAAGNSAGTYNGNGTDNSSVAAATLLDNSSQSDDQCSDDQDNSSSSDSNCSSDSDSGSSYDSSSSSDSGSSSDSSSSDS